MIVNKLNIYKKTKYSKNNKKKIIKKIKNPINNKTQNRYSKNKS